MCQHQFALKAAGFLADNMGVALNLAENCKNTID